MASRVFNDSRLLATKQQGLGLLTITASICIAASLWTRHTARRPPLPPSPPPNSWFGGHRYLMPNSGNKELFWQVFTRLARQYGDVMYLSIDGQDTIVLSSYEAVSELFHVRGAKYSDRLYEPWFTEIMGWGKFISFRSYDAYWRKSRRLANIGFSKQAAERYHEAQAKDTHVFLQRLLAKPDDWEKQVHCHVASNVMRIIYGYSVEDASDPLVKTVHDAVASLQCWRYSPRWVMKTLKRFPSLCNLPSWLPGMGWKRRLLKETHWPEEMSGRPWTWTKQQLENGTARSSFISRLLEENKEGLEGEDLIKWLSVSMFSAGSHTTVAAIINFIIAMVRHPEAAKRAREEIDHVVGQERLPGMADREKLVYVECLIQEVLRWRSVTPLGLQHRIAVEDEYRGYRIPAGSTVVADIHAIMHDEKLFPSPEQFRPDRFLDPTKSKPTMFEACLKPRDLVFGIGRRACPGFHVADSTLFLTISCMLATVEISLAKREKGPLDVGYVSGFVAMPLPFKCSIKPRSDAAVKLVNQTVLFEEE